MHALAAFTSSYSGMNSSKDGNLLLDGERFTIRCLGFVRHKHPTGVLAYGGRTFQNFGVLNIDPRTTSIEKIKHI